MTATIAPPPEASAPAAGAIDLSPFVRDLQRQSTCSRSAFRSNARVKGLGRQEVLLWPMV